MSGVFLETDTEVINSLSESRPVRCDIVTALWSKCPRLAAGRILKRRAYSEFLFQDKNSIWWECVTHSHFGWSWFKAPASTGTENSWALETTTFLKIPGSAEALGTVQYLSLPMCGSTEKQRGIWQHLHHWPADRTSRHEESSSWSMTFVIVFQSCWITTSLWESQLRTAAFSVQQTVVFTFWQIDEEHKDG